MLKKLQKKLTIICTIMVSIVLLAQMIFSFIYMERQYLDLNHLITQNDIMAIVNKLQSKDTIQIDWLAQYETNKKSVIHIESGGRPIFFSGSYLTGEDRSLLINQVKQIALTNGLDISLPIIDSSETRQMLFEIKSGLNIYYCGIVKIPANQSWQSLIYIQDQKSVVAYLDIQSTLYTVTAIFTIFVLSFLSHWFSGLAIRPIWDNIKSQQDFIAAASHEMRAPLTVMSTSLATIKVRPEHTAHLLCIIESECTLLNNLVGDLLMLASVSSESWSMSKNAIETDTLLLECVEELTTVAGAKGYCLTIDLPEQLLPLIIGDKTRIKQVITILIHNAICHAHGGERIEVIGTCDTKNVFIDIVDHGVGIPDEIKTRIFERFFQAESAHSEKSHFGLGLSIAAELVSMHHGAINVMDTDGGGCTMRLVFSNTRI